MLSRLLRPTRHTSNRGVIGITGHSTRAMASWQHNLLVSAQTAAVEPAVPHDPVADAAAAAAAESVGKLCPLVPDMPNTATLAFG